MKYQEIKKEIESFGFSVVSHDFERPWGEFLVIDEKHEEFDLLILLNFDLKSTF
ncbi:hypothetical protein N9763_07005 [Polaribacter sp.]|nr:hypothetical protein [Polaribacter sp.]